ncbi:BGAL7 [Acrasis kona]|uniref:Beta-galactosidase n=1 Tax=Acrasis kona TaxID=1008807 RepID=A0AAW2Z4N8_9EUKA
MIFLTTISVSKKEAGWLTYDELAGKPYTVAYDDRAITINGKRTMLLAAVIHYPRSSPAMWKDLFNKVKLNGLNTIQTYVFWNIHEKKRGQKYNFDFNYDLFRFLDLAREAGLFVNLRIGPYVCAEWNYGGLPVWLNNIPNMAFRSNNEPWKKEMGRFVTDVARMVEPYLARRGGPIILSQIENEFRDGDPEYINWCGKLIEDLNIQVPWIMCSGDSANQTILACNSCNCVDDGFVEEHSTKHPHQPLMWTENEGWFEQWGTAQATRSPQDLAYSVLGWIAAGGSYHAYYMWHGGNNYGLSAASMITTKYAYDVNLHSDGTFNEPKFSHLGNVHRITSKYASVLLQQDKVERVPIPVWNQHTSQWVISTEQFAYEYTHTNGSHSLTFLYSKSKVQVNVLYHHLNITMSAKSVLMLDRDDTVLFNTSQVGSTLIRSKSQQIVKSSLSWKAWKEPIDGLNKVPVIKSNQLLEQLNVTQDDVNRMWYRVQVNQQVDDDQDVNISFKARHGSAYLFFVNDEFKGQVVSMEQVGDFKLTKNFKILKKNNYILSVLSVSFGLHNGVHKNQKEYKGILGEFLLNNKDISHDLWTHQKGLLGDHLGIVDPNVRMDVVPWDDDVEKYKNTPLVWYVAEFDVPNKVSQLAVNNPVSVKIDQGSLHRGHVFVNGFDLGMYYTTPGKCEGSVPCSEFVKDMCGKPTQIYYHIPPELVKERRNKIVIIEEIGGNVKDVQIVSNE